MCRDTPRSEEAQSCSKSMAEWALLKDRSSEGPAWKHELVMQYAGHEAVLGLYGRSQESALPMTDMTCACCTPSTGLETGIATFQQGLKTSAQGVDACPGCALLADLLHGSWLHNRLCPCARSVPRRPDLTPMKIWLGSRSAFCEVPASAQPVLNVKLRCVMSRSSSVNTHKTYPSTGKQDSNSVKAKHCELTQVNLIEPSAYLPGMDMSGFAKAAPSALLMLAAGLLMLAVGLLAVWGGAAAFHVCGMGMLCCAAAIGVGTGP